MINNSPESYMLVTAYHTFFILFFLFSSYIKKYNIKFLNNCLCYKYFVNYIALVIPLGYYNFKNKIIKRWTVPTDL
jgi:membrane-anchored glycerophosphoryl diester phosphodiesterase (GDPDase)